MALSREMKENLAPVVAIAGTVIHYGYLPLIIYLGFKRGAEPGMPELTLLNLLWQ